MTSSKLLGVVYSDPNCPFCYAMGERLHALGVSEQVEWRGVQHAPHLTIPLAPASAGLARELEAEVAAIGQLAPELPIAKPIGKPNTAPAILAIAQALRHDPGAGHVFKDSVYRAFWVHGRDISSPDELERLAAEANLPPLVEMPPADDLVRAWARSWMELGTGGVPLLIRTDGRGLVGLTTMAKLAQLFDRKLPDE